MLSAEHRVGVRWRTAAAGTVCGATAAGAVWAAARLSGADLQVHVRGEAPAAVPLGAVLTTSLAAGLAAALLAAAARRLRRPRTAFLAVCGAGLGLSAVPPLLAAGTAGTAAALLAMHLAVAAAVVPPLARRLPRGVRHDPSAYA